MTGGKWITEEARRLVSMVLQRKNTWISDRLAAIKIIETDAAPEPEKVCESVSGWCECSNATSNRAGPRIYHSTMAKCDKCGRPVRVV